MTLLKSLRNLALAAVLLSAGAAHAALLNFQLTGDYTASWQFDSNVVPDASEENLGFSVYDVEGDFPGSLFGVVDLSFFAAENLGGLEIDDFYGELVLLLADGSQLYTGTEDNPMFSLGTFALTQFEGAGTYTLTISGQPPVSVPEPASAALLLGGLALLAASRKRRSLK